MTDAISFPGKIHLITNDGELSLVAEALNSATELGFDTETRPSFRKGEVYKVALLQLATDHDAFLIRLHGIRQFQPIARVLENDKIIKAGVAIRDDIKGLQKLFKFTPQKFVELQDLSKSKGLKNMGLRGMADEVLQGHVIKGPKTTNWENPILTDRQLMYAATDAWVGLKLYQKLSAADFKVDAASAQ